MKRIFLCCSAAVMVLALAAPVLAHAFLDHAEPAVGAKIAASPTQVKIWFTEEVEPAFTAVQVFDAVGKEVDKKDVQQDAKDKKLMSVSVPQLAPGVYKVTWQAVAADTHKTTGSFTFTVAAQGAATQ